MSAIVPFQFEDHAVRIRDRNGQPWFVASDVCDVLEISKHRDAVARLDDDETASVIVDTPGGPQAVAAINESGLYKLILRSRKAAAKRFTKWITAEVLPAIRRTGSYGAPAAALDLNDPATLRRLLLDHTGQALALEQRLERAEPKAAALARLTEAQGSLCITDAAKALRMPPKALFTWLTQNGWIYRRTGGSHWIGYQGRVQAGFLDHKVTRLDRGPYEPAKFVEQVLITPKGIAKLAELLAKGSVGGPNGQPT